MKIVGAVIAVVLLIAVGIFAYVALNTNSIVKNAIESIGSEYLGAPVRVGSVEISLQDGSGTLKDLTIGNPPGYVGPYAVRVGLVSMTLDVASSNTGLIVLKTVVVDGAQVAAIAKSKQDTNLGALARNAPVSDSPAPKFIIDRLDLTNTQASVASSLVPQAIDVDVPDVHLTQIGRASSGVDVGQVIEQILTPIRGSITAQLRTAALQRLFDPRKLTSDARRRMQDTLKSLGHPQD